MGEAPVQVRVPGLVGLEDPRGLHALVVQRHGVVGVGAEEPVEHRAVAALMVEPLVPGVSNSYRGDPRDMFTQFPHARVDRLRRGSRGILQAVEDFERQEQAHAGVRGCVVRLPGGVSAGGIGVKERAQPEGGIIVFQPLFPGPPYRGSFSSLFCAVMKSLGCHLVEVG